MTHPALAIPANSLLACNHSEEYGDPLSSPLICDVHCIPDGSLESPMSLADASRQAVNIKLTSNSLVILSATFIEEKNVISSPLGVNTVYKVYL